MFCVPSQTADLLQFFQRTLFLISTVFVLNVKDFKKTLIFVSRESVIMCNV